MHNPDSFRRLLDKGPFHYRQIKNKFDRYDQCIVDNCERVICDVDDKDNAEAIIAILNEHRKIMKGEI